MLEQLLFMQLLDQIALMLLLLGIPRALPLKFSGLAVFQNEQIACNFACEVSAMDTWDYKSFVLLSKAFPQANVHYLTAQSITVPRLV